LDSIWGVQSRVAREFFVEGVEKKAKFIFYPKELRQAIKTEGGKYE